MSKINCFNILTKKQSDFFLDEINGLLKSSKYDFISLSDSFLTNYSFKFIFDGEEAEFSANTNSRSGKNLEKEGAFEKHVLLYFYFNFGGDFGSTGFLAGTFIAAVDNGEMKVRFDEELIDECYKELMETLLDSIRKENS